LFINCFSEYFDYKKLEKTIIEFKNRYDLFDVGTLGCSILGKSIPRITLGNGKKSVIYIGAHHGMEWITSAILIKFIDDYAKEFQNGHQAFDISTRVLYETRKIHIIPMLNPDGIDYAIHGIDQNNVMKDRLLKMNSNSKDFSKWQANARGVDLNHNYSFGFEEYKIIEKELGISNGAPTKFSGEYSESEPETSSLCNYVRLEKPHLALSLHTQGEEIYYTSGDKMAVNSLPIVKTLSRLTGYKISIPTGTACFGGFTDWFINEFNRPSFTLECGLGTNPLPFNNLDKIYSSLKRALFTAPILI
jgi:g-D-glutamyl-meso-diaminopimelate peptidase